MTRASYACERWLRDAHSRDAAGELFIVPLAAIPFEQWCAPGAQSAKIGIDFPANCASTQAVSSTAALCGHFITYV
jgi:hypothetical protein